MNEEKIPPRELEQFLATLRQSLRDHQTALGGQTVFHGLPVEEWAGPGYALGALFDPYVLAAELQPAAIHLVPPAAADGLETLDTRTAQKEKIVFRAGSGRRAVYQLPMLWGGVSWQRFRASADWQVAATVAEWPALLTRPGQAVFAFNPLQVIHRYLNMADPASTADFTDLIVHAVLASSGCDRELDDDPLRRDFHALGVNSLLLGQLHLAAGRAWNPAVQLPELRAAAAAYIAGDRAAAEQELARLFARFAESRRQLVATPVYLIVMPHGGILFEGVGYAEYDSPELAARVLNLLLDWAETCRVPCAPDIGAGTLEEFAKLYPATIARLRAAWDNGRIELVNGTYGQPYLQLWPRWDQDQQFEQGLAVFQNLFGRRPTVYAAQEIAHHPALPDLLVRHGYRHAIHRAQNLGLAPLDAAPLIDWQSPSGASVRALPSHPLRSERRGGEIWRHLPILLTSERNAGLPFIALTSLMDQTFIDLYNEEIVRAHRYAAVWGDFVTPTDFFARTASHPAVPRRYRIDDYHYALDLSGNSIHGHQTGGYSSQHAFVFNASRQLQTQERIAATDLKKLLNQQAHDCYIIPYFATGYFMEGIMTDYHGPRYRCGNDLPRGLVRAIRDDAGYPARCADPAPARPEPCRIAGTALTGGSHRVVIDPRNGAVSELDGRRVNLGALGFDGAPFAVAAIAADDHRLKLDGALPGFGPVRLEYFISGNRLYAEASVAELHRGWVDTAICWGSCVYFEHAVPPETALIRTVGDVSEPTAKERFHSLDTLTLAEPGQTLTLRHGGNIFFRREVDAVRNRLWCYDEFCDRFWWAVDLV